MVGRFPICYINIEMDPILVDVNVHPTKLEVRLSKEDQLFELIVEKIREAFKDRILIPQNDMNKLTQKNKVLDKFEQQKIDFEKRKQQRDATHSTNLNFDLDDNQPNETKQSNQSLDNTLSSPNTTPDDSYSVQESTYDYAKTQRDVLNDMEEQDITDTLAPSEDVAEASDIKGSISSNPSQRIPYMEVVGQVHGTYIIAQNENGMFMIDQHAAQERIKYEYFREKIGDVSNEIQNLLIPLTFHFSKDELMIINQHVEELDKVGVHLEPFGGNDYIVDSYPVWFPAAEAEEIIKDMIEYVLEHKKVNVKKIREEAAIMMSCKKSIKANHYLKNNEMADLVNQLRETEDPFTCPHGRPIIINFSNYELERLFKRII